MSAFKGTPGPWEAHQRPASPIEYGHHVTTADGLTVCNVTYQLPARIDGEVVEVSRIANARLIAASPRMYDYIAVKARAGDKEAQEIISGVDHAQG